MTNSVENAVISYSPQPFFRNSGNLQASGVTNVESFSLTTPTGLFSPDLSDYSELTITEGEQYFVFEAEYDRQPFEMLSTAKTTVALIGCALISYEDDGMGSPVLETETYEDICCTLSGIGAESYLSFAHNSTNAISTFDQTAMPGIISGGTSNLVFSGLPPFSTGDSSPDEENVTYTFTLTRTFDSVVARPHAKFIVGHLFVGLELPIMMNPNSFQWNMDVNKNSYRARNSGTINSDGAIVRRCSGEINLVDNYSIVGSKVVSVGSVLPGGQIVQNDAPLYPNLFDLIKVNSSYPLLVNPYPYTVNSTDQSVTAAEFNSAGRQNFFAIYGFLQGGLEIGSGQFRNGLESAYSARFRIEETR